MCESGIIGEGDEVVDSVWDPNGRIRKSPRTFFTFFFFNPSL